MGKGFLILITGIALLIGTLIWIYIDKKNKGVRSEELLKKISESNSNLSMNDETEIMLDDRVLLHDSTELLYDSTELLDDTEII